MPFPGLIDGVDGVEQACAPWSAGRGLRDIHLECHRLLAGVLRLGIVAWNRSRSLRPASRVFFPHGVGHLLGIQVHDVAGFMAGPDGGRIEPPEGHPFLRLTRTLVEDSVVTIEPGLYFIPMLLAPLREGPHAAAVDWKQVAHLQAYGGVRIEDNVRAAADGPENLTRDAGSRHCLGRPRPPAAPVPRNPHAALAGAGLAGSAGPVAARLGRPFGRAPAATGALPMPRNCAAGCGRPGHGDRPAHR